MISWRNPVKSWQFISAWGIQTRSESSLTTTKMLLSFLIYYGIRVVYLVQAHRDALLGSRLDYMNPLIIAASAFNMDEPAAPITVL